MKIYVAGASRERNERAKPVIKALREAGIEITYDWTQNVDQYPPDSPAPSDEYLQNCAQEDHDGVVNADQILVLLPEDSHSTGAWAELGIALGSCVPVMVSGSPQALKKCIFLHMPRVQKFLSDDDAVEWLIKVHTHVKTSFTDYPNYPTGFSGTQGIPPETDEEL